MKQNQDLNNTCILFDKEDEAQQKAIIKFYNDGGWFGKEDYMRIESDEKYIGVFEGELGYWFHANQVIELPSDYYPKIVESESNNGWISVEDKPTPEFDGEFLCVVLESEECNQTYFRQRVLQCLFNNWVVKHNQSVTHWRELPPFKSPTQK